jgi:hypothetical protein
MIGQRAVAGPARVDDQLAERAQALERLDDGLQRDEIAPASDDVHDARGRVSHRRARLNGREWDDVESPTFG